MLYKVLPATAPIGEPLHAMVHPLGEADAVLGRWARMVGRVHGAMDRRGVAAESADLGYVDEGEYVHDPLTGEPLVLRVPSDARAPELAFVHALGLYVDQEHLGDGLAPASETHPAAGAIVEAALAAPSLAGSIAFVKALGRRLAERGDGPPALDAGRTAWERENHAGFLRLLSARETFARVYTQYVAETMRPPALRIQIAGRMTEMRDAGAFPLFWEREEFVSIAMLLHDVLIEKELVALRT